MCLTSDAVYRIRDADAIFRIERKDDQKIAQKSKLFYRKYFEFTSNHSGSVRGTLWRIVSKYILFLRMVQSFYHRYLQNTTNNVTGAQEDHDRSRYAAYSVKTVADGSRDNCCTNVTNAVTLGPPAVLTYPTLLHIRCQSSTKL